MKKFIQNFILLSGMLLIITGCSFKSLPVDINTAATDHSLWYYVVTICLSIYEVLVRVIPTIANNSIIHWILKLLTWLSNVLNVTKSVNKTP